VLCSCQISKSALGRHGSRFQTWGVLVPSLPFCARVLFLLTFCELAGLGDGRASVVVYVFRWVCGPSVATYVPVRASCKLQHGYAKQDITCFAHNTRTHLCDAPIPASDDAANTHHVRGPASVGGIHAYVHGDIGCVAKFVQELVYFCVRVKHARIRQQKGYRRDTAMCKEHSTDRSTMAMYFFFPSVDFASLRNSPRRSCQ